jgi:glucokinase
MTERPVLAIDIGGTKLAVAVVDANGAVIRRAQAPTKPSEAGRGDELFAALMALVDDVVAGEEISGVGIGCGGPIDWTNGLVSPLNFLAWRDFPLRARVAARFPGVPVRLANDAIAVAIGEHWKGAGAGANNVLGVVISTGVGGGLVIDRRVVWGETGNAGHLGHVVVDPDGPECACGGRGCLEAIARGPAVVQWALDNGWRSSEAEPDGRALADAARAGDEVAVAAFVRAGTASGIAFASAAHLLELDVIAVAGGLASVGDLLMVPIRTAFARHAKMAFASRCRTQG